jgi:transposase InsO family protein
MILMMVDRRVMDIGELKALLASSDVLTFKGNSREEIYAWIELTLRSYKYRSRPRLEKGVLRQYMQKITGISCSQLTRLITQFRRSGHVRVRPYQRHSFPTKYTREDQLLLAELDNNNERLSGKATVAIFKREYKLFGKDEYQRLSGISVAHLYRLRQGSFYRHHTLTIEKTKPSSCKYGERRRPDPQGKPGFIRVDTVHQGDLNGEKGVYHINTIDEVTQWEVLGCVEKISERYLVPVLKHLMTQYPFTIHGVHSDNGSEYVNKKVVALLNKLLIEFTKSRARHTNDQALVEGKNGSIIRKHMGHWHIPQSEATKIQSFYNETFNEYLNFHRPCGFATETVDEKGKIKKQYNDYFTPFEKLQTLTKPEQFLKEGVTMKSLKEVEQQRSDIECAKLMQEKKIVLFRSFSKPGILT